MFLKYGGFQIFQALLGEELEVDKTISDIPTSAE